ncbi:MAG: NADH:flavin oxidoreductase [Deltaproteobacteria bacterium]|nr:NADH:flavin oxidoreductase [Deltaproteobacteria bacterium]
MDSLLFTATKIKNINLKNRFVRSATFENMATPDGRPTQMLKEMYNDLAEGEVGLIVTGLAHVDGYKNLQGAKGIPFPLAIDEDRFIDDWRDVIEGVHKHGAKIAMQIIHPGRQDIPHIREPVAPSAVRLENSDRAPREMTANEIHELIEKFAQSCRRVKEAGFDAVQLHGGHGYLISNFISPYFNIRDDSYGGSTHNRARFITEIIKRARKMVGPEFPIMIKMNFDDFIKGGLNRDEAVRIAKIIVQAGIDAIEVTGGVSSHNPLSVSAKAINREKDEAYFQSYAKALKKQVPVPVILVGGIRSISVIDKLIRDEITDFIAMCRPFICEPGLIKRWKEGDSKKAKCISCNKCRENLPKQSVRCYLNESLERT